jgi:hypothetical protein
MPGAGIDGDLDDGDFRGQVQPAFVRMWKEPGPYDIKNKPAPIVAEKNGGAIGPFAAKRIRKIPCAAIPLRFPTLLESRGCRAGFPHSDAPIAEAFFAAMRFRVPIHWVS